MSRSPELLPTLIETPSIKQPVHLITPDLANLYSLTTLQAYTYAIYTPNHRPTPIPPLTDDPNIPRYCFYLEREPHLLDHSTHIPSLLRPYYFSDNGIGPALTRYQHIAGFFMLDHHQASSKEPIAAESAHLIDYPHWPDSGPILDFGSFTPNPLTSTYEKMLTLRKLLSSAFDFAQDLAASHRMFVIMSSRIRNFVATAGIRFEVLGGTKSNDEKVKKLVYNQFPGYWNDDPMLCRFISVTP